MSQKNYFSKGKDMILIKEVEITLQGRYASYYENKGYEIPRYFDKTNNQMSIKRGTKIIVKVLDLPKNSNVKVLCKCDNNECGKERLLKYQSYHSLCNECCYLQESVRIKMSKNHFNCFGKNNPNWNPMLTNEERNLSNRRSILPENYTWKILVKERDNNTCQCCGEQENICVHHINNWKEYPEQRFNINNGITLCGNCHKQLHHKFGLQTVKEHLEEFLNQGVEIC
jgi:hypothetical protein